MTLTPEDAEEFHEKLTSGQEGGDWAEAKVVEVREAYGLGTRWPYRDEGDAALAAALREAEERNPQIVCPKCGEGSIDQPHLHACLADMLAQARRDAFQEALKHWSETAQSKRGNRAFFDWLRAKTKDNK